MIIMMRLVMKVIQRPPCGSNGDAALVANTEYANRFLAHQSLSISSFDADDGVDDDPPTFVRARRSFAAVSSS